MTTPSSPLPFPHSPPHLVPFRHLFVSFPQFYNLQLIPPTSRFPSSPTCLFSFRFFFHQIRSSSSPFFKVSPLPLKNIFFSNYILIPFASPLLPRSFSIILHQSPILSFFFLLISGSSWLFILYPLSSPLLPSFLLFSLLFPEFCPSSVPPLF